MDAVHATESSRLVGRGGQQETSGLQAFSEAAYDWSWEEIVHKSIRCPGRKDPSRMNALIAEVKEVIPVIEWAA
jgi:hypothetical protein